MNSLGCSTPTTVDIPSKGCFFWVPNNGGEGLTLAHPDIRVKDSPLKNWAPKIQVEVVNFGFQPSNCRTCPWARPDYIRNLKTIKDVIISVIFWKLIQKQVKV